MLSGVPTLHRVVQTVASMNKRNFKSYGVLVNQAFSQFNENPITNQDLHSQIEKNDTQGEDYPNESNSKDTERNTKSAILNFMQKILPDDEIGEGINSKFVYLLIYLFIYLFS